MNLNDVKLNKPISTNIGLLTPIKTKKEGMEIYMLICQTANSNLVLKQTMSEQKIIQETYLAIYKDIPQVGITLSTPEAMRLLSN